ncbi:MAG: hypothetical protein KatS3mg039_1730 [Candidatus Kapaibacterium sp.]|nr:MAG: hypothetical protein KatS3mg039_1730 [Candidatus Kapabacteria bacterium]GIV55310.1 MAG: hypothetical protein KatS3mg040_0078 [Candidatus Kapabacteria bacterium]
MSRVTLCFLVAVALLAQEQPHIELRFTVSDERSSGITLRCGIDSTATDGIDPSLGEFPLPGHPPSGFHAAWEIVTDGIGDLSYADFRPYPASAGEHFYREYSLNVSPKLAGRGDLLIFRWEYPFPRGIDSVVVSDRLQGALVRFAFSPKGADTISGSFAELERFLVRVYYTPSQVLSVKDTRRIHSSALSLADGTFFLPVPFQPASLTVYALDGKQCAVPYTYDGSAFCIRADSLPHGWYVFVAISPRGEKVEQVFVR